MRVEQTNLYRVPDLSPVADFLVELYLGLNKFNDLENSLPRMPKLTRLHLDRCCVGSASFYTSPFPKDPTFFAKIPNIRFLDLDDNKITHLRGEISQLRQLVELKLGENDIGDNGFPSSLGTLQHIGVLNLNNNKMTKYPKFLQHMTQTSLTDIRLSGMPTLVKNLPSFFWNTSAHSFKRVDLLNCSLTSVPLGLKGMSALENLQLQGNNLTTIPTWLNRQTFSRLHTLILTDITRENYAIDNPMLPTSCYFVSTHGNNGGSKFYSQLNKRRCTVPACLVSPIQVEKLCSKGEYLTDCTVPCLYFRKTVGKYCKGKDGV